jgi:hypothetical protein
VPMKPDDEFEQLALPLRRELVAFCYRMTGSACPARRRWPGRPRGTERVPCCSP